METNFILELAGAGVPVRTPGPKHSLFFGSKGDISAPTSSNTIFTLIPIPPMKDSRKGSTSSVVDFFSDKSTRRICPDHPYSTLTPPTVKQ
jgi:hypothetical protein